MKRRDFLTKGLATGVTADAALSAVVDKDWSALDDTVSLGFIGVGGRWMNNAPMFGITNEYSLPNS